jgi:prepilin-type N-terminal cleavage/methylation domain-containing protein
MRSDRGYTLTELLIASAVMVTVLAAVTTLLHEGLIGVPALEEAGDLHQRVRVAADALAADVRSAAAGAHFGRLSDYFAVVLPRRLDEAPASASSDVITITYVPPHGASSRLVADLASGAPTALIEGVAGCPVLTTACGFNAGTRAVVFDDIGHADFVAVDAIGPGMLSVSDVAGRSTSYPAGSRIAETVSVTYTFDAAARQLRRSVGSASFVLVDNVTQVRFAYFDSALADIPPAAMMDGPFRGAGATMFDTDLERVRVVRVTLRLETGVDELRGADPTLFARPGTATGRRMVPDVETTFAVAMRNPGRG